jgi:hypothetical protein
MANALYPKWKESLIQATANSALNGSGATGVYAALVDTGVYTYDAADVFWDEGGANDAKDGLIGTAMEIGATKTYTNGVFDGANITYSAVTGNNAEALVIFIKNAGAETTWRLVAYIDTGVTGLPVLPNGGDITLTFNASGIFAL